MEPKKLSIRKLHICAYSVLCPEKFNFEFIIRIPRV